MNEVEEILGNKLIEELSPLLLKQLKKLDETGIAEFKRQYNKKKKSIAIGLLTWLFGLHYIYLGKLKTWLLYIFTGGGILIWWIIDLFRLTGMIKEYNEEVAIEILSKLKAIQM